MTLASPHGGVLQHRYLNAAAARAEQARARDYPSWDLDLTQLGWLELLLSGALSPLTGYLSQADSRRILAEKRLADTNGTFWPTDSGLTLTVSAEFIAKHAIAAGSKLALRDPEGVLIAVLDVSDSWQDAGSAETVHLGGPVIGIEAPRHYDFPALRRQPDAVRAVNDDGLLCGIAVYNPLSPNQHAAALAHLTALNATAFVAVSIGTPPPDDRRHYARVRCHQALLGRYSRASLNLLPLPAATTPETLLLTAIVLQNYGCRYALFDAGSAGPAARQQVEHGCRELSVEARFIDATTGPGEVFPELRSELELLHPPKLKQGFTVFFTGLSGSGKSTVANALLTRLLALGTGSRNITLLDGDRVRKHLSSELGFSKDHRNINILRIGYVASEITKHGGIAICAPIAPYIETRQAVREMIEVHGGFIEVHVATPLAECERRDRKGLYAKARAGLIKEFTGISDPYQAPLNPELVIDTTEYEPVDAAERVIARLRELGYL